MTGILIIHGFAGARDELKVLYDYLSNKGFMVAMPLLAGHEGSRKDLSMSCKNEWIKSAEEVYLELYKACDKIIVIGFSMGGLIATQLYQKYKFDKLVTINTPVYYWDIRRIIKNIYCDFKKYTSKYFAASTNKPIRSLLEFQKLLSSTKALFKTINCDTLIIQTQDDDTVNIKSADYIYKKVPGKKQILKQKNGGHIVFTSNYYNETLERINEFI